MSDEAERRRRAAEDAASWLLRLESGSLSLEERTQFVDWLRESPVHIAEMLHVSRLRNSLAAFSGWENIAPLDRSQDAPVAAVSISPGGLVPFVRPRWPRMSSRGWFASAVAVVAVVAVFSAMLAGRLRQTVISTQVGERREFTLADGSEVSIAPDSIMRVTLGAHERLVVLNRGQAFFHVSKDPNRPFIVDAGHARTRAVGTSFNVERLNDVVVVTVVEGRVAVSPANRRLPGAGASSVPSISVGANEQVAIAANGSAAPVRQVNSTRATAWLQGQLIFDNDTVAEVVRRFNMYNRVQVRILDDSLGLRPVTGVFRATDPESFVAFLHAAAGVRVSRADTNEILIDLPAVGQTRDTPR